MCGRKSFPILPASQLFEVHAGESERRLQLHLEQPAQLRISSARSQRYEGELITARENAIREMEQGALQTGANAIVGDDIDYEVLGRQIIC